MNLPLFLQKFHDAASRERLQPSLVFSGLALAQMLQSSERGQGAVGMDRALRLRDAAEAALNAAVACRWFDPGLAQAAWVRPELMLTVSTCFSTSASRCHCRCSPYSRQALSQNIQMSDS